MCNGLQNSELNFEQLYEQGRQSVPMVQDLGDRILSDLQTKHPGLFDSAEFQNGPLKTLNRATAKIQGDYNGNHSEISDLARGRIIVDTPEQIEALRQYFHENTEPLGIEKYKDRFAEPSDTGFRDINTKMRLKNGHVIEFRIEHRDMLNAAKATHDPYEDVQKIERRANVEDRDLTIEEDFERQKILDEIRDIHGHPATMSDLDQLLNDKGRSKIASHESERVTPHIDAEIIQSRIALANAHPQNLVGRIASLTGEFAKKAGPMAGPVLGAGAGAATYLATGDTAEAAEIFYEAAVPYGETQIDLARGDIEAAAKSSMVETASIGGALAGGAAGFVVGGPVGAVVGGLAGGLGTGIAADALLDMGPGALEDISMDEARSKLVGLSEKDVRDMSPETQSLHVFREHPGAFEEQYIHLQEIGGLPHVGIDMKQIELPVAEPQIAPAPTIARAMQNSGLAF